MISRINALTLSMVILFLTVPGLAQYTGGSYDGYAMGTSAAESSLPVELTSFTASQVRAGIELEWVTASETENLGFVLERRETGTRDWEEVANFQTHQELEGSGNSTHRTAYKFLDATVKYGNTYDYCLTDVSYSTVNRSNPVIITNITVEEIQPLAFSLQHAYPNPFNPAITIGYTLPTEGYVSLSVYDLKGKVVTTLVDGEKSAGEYSIHWNAIGEDAGIYLLQLVTKDIRQVQRITLLK